MVTAKEAGAMSHKFTIGLVFLLTFGRGKNPDSVASTQCLLVSSALHCLVVRGRRVHSHPYRLQRVVYISAESFGKGKSLKRNSKETA
jgi:hypothetical protein